MAKINQKLENKRSHKEIDYSINKQICETYIRKKKENSKFTQEMLIEHFNTILGFNIPTTTMSGILRKKEEIIEHTEKTNVYSIRGAKYPKLEDALIFYYDKLTSNNIPITSAILLEKARKFGTMLQIKDFTYSTEWLDRFK